MHNVLLLRVRDHHLYIEPYIGSLSAPGLNRAQELAMVKGFLCAAICAKMQEIKFRNN